ncbi:MAG: hypothetical protein V3S65_09355, partial [Candidatus Aminicenantaceae bacterium]
MEKPQKKSIDITVNKMLERTFEQGIETVWDRSDQQKARCGFGEQGLCCRLCFMGPCRINPKGKSPQRGVCGATAEVIVARNFARMVAAGASAHSDHGRGVAKTLMIAAKSPESGYTIKDVNKLKKVAQVFGIDVKDRDKQDIAKDVAERAMAIFGQQEGKIDLIKLAPEKRQNLWHQLKITPRGIDREIVEMMHRTNMGVDHDHRNIMLQASRTALADGWGGSMIATELQDILFGTPSPLRGQVNLGVLSEKDVNIVVHGHEPVLSEMLVEAAQNKELLDMAKSKGAQGINLAGICCTANEILIRHGLPIAGNILQQELSLATGAVDAMIVDVQCIMPSLPEISKHYHTQLITTSSKGKMDDVKYFP